MNHGAAARAVIIGGEECDKDSTDAGSRTAIFIPWIVRVTFVGKQEEPYGAKDTDKHTAGYGIIIVTVGVLYHFTMTEKKITNDHCGREQQAQPAYGFAKRVERD